MVKFYKMHSLGNDFMVLDAVTEACSLTEDQIPQWADRNEGIGFDQLLIIAPPQQPDADFTIKFSMPTAVNRSNAATAHAVLRCWRDS